MEIYDFKTPKGNVMMQSRSQWFICILIEKKNTKNKMKSSFMVHYPFFFPSGNINKKISKPSGV